MVSLPAEPSSFATIAMSDSYRSSIPPQASFNHRQQGTPQVSYPNIIQMCCLTTSTKISTDPVASGVSRRVSTTNPSGSVAGTYAGMSVVTLSPPGSARVQPAASSLSSTVQNRVNSFTPQAAALSAPNAPSGHSPNISTGSSSQTRVNSSTPQFDAHYPPRAPQDPLSGNFTASSGQNPINRSTPQHAAASAPRPLYDSAEHLAGLRLHNPTHSGSHQRTANHLPTEPCGRVCWTLQCESPSPLLIPPIRI